MAGFWLSLFPREWLLENCLWAGSVAAYLLGAPTLVG